ncbi:uncharacterized protein PHACADRAFT_162099 [Phanerochaete carnosa HHB-10118-sp]|uniref:ER membrane protein complex subunit 4 n=1 Tax=Phanerochaete carnosa (strain HHB-10118-sp) TaxID=650164 RepID=K5VWW7_PHACS|nr:uncharacterized protein PHACADRAFT_162099 [Phanerochaete carnosa HHB-10118-sp]EKM56058.1 hypothetical protein PHACADRAFT_162099 [Phanerochaete carnosa HHB-10118-sp]
MQESIQSAHRWRHLPPPPGFSNTPVRHASAPSKASTAVSANYETLKDKRAWDFAISPAKSLPMQAFMLYMSGGGVQIFSMGIVFMLLLSPFKNLAGVNSAFAPFAPVPTGKKAAPNPGALTTLVLQKVVYLLCNLLTLALGLWKCHSMGLLPTGTGDWLAFETRSQPPEFVLL